MADTPLLAVSCGPPNQGGTGGERKAISDGDIKSIHVEQDLDQPDMCVVALHDDDQCYVNEIALGHEVEVKCGEVRIFKGEVVAIEPTYRVGEADAGVCVVRAFDKLHRLTRGRNTRTFVDQSDCDIASAIASQNGLSPDADDTGAGHKHVQQHNQTDLEFLRLRAARIGFEIRVDDAKLLFKKPTTGDPTLELLLPSGDAAKQGGSDKVLLKGFAARLSSAGIVQEVEVRGYNHAKPEEFSAKVPAQPSNLGKTLGSKQAEVFEKRVTSVVDVPVKDAKEAEVVGKAYIRELNLDFIVADATANGDEDTAAARPGNLVGVQVSQDGKGRFDGTYQLAGVSHRYVHSNPGLSGGYTVALRIRRDAEGKK
jgi:phage protein D